jgi:hypothetical protein
MIDLIFADNPTQKVGNQAETLVSKSVINTSSTIDTRQPALLLSAPRFYWWIQEKRIGMKSAVQWIGKLHRRIHLKVRVERIYAIGEDDSWCLNYCQLL